MIFEDVLFPIKNGNVFNPKDALIHGNIFADTWEGYKSYKDATIIPTSSKGELLLKIYEYDFALNDLNLYLDLNPDNQAIYELFKKDSLILHDLVCEYESLYGPMELCDSDYDAYMWITNPWPWTKEGSNV